MYYAVSAACFVCMHACADLSILVSRRPCLRVPVSLAMAPSLPPILTLLCCPGVQQQPGIPRLPGLAVSVGAHLLSTCQSSSQLSDWHVSAVVFLYIDAIGD